MSAATKVNKTIPVIYTVAYSPLQMGVNKPDNMTGVYDSLDMSGMLNNVIRVLPGIKVIGTVYNPSEPNAEFAVKKLEEECKKRDIELIKTTILSVNDIELSVLTLADKGVQAIIESSDNVVFTGIELVVKICNRRKIPLFVTEPVQTGRGAVLGYGVDYESWGQESGKLAVRILNGEKPNAIPDVPLLKRQLIINLKAEKLQGVIIPQSLLETADKVIN